MTTQLQENILGELAIMLLQTFSKIEGKLYASPFLFLQQFVSSFFVECCDGLNN